MRKLQLVVEGAGDIAATRLLIKRILEKNQIFDTTLLPPHKRGGHPNVVTHFENFFQAAIKEKAPILWILDFDDKVSVCPVEEANKLLHRAKKLRPEWPIEIAFLVKEYEVLFLHDETATRTVFPDIPKNVSFPTIPEAIRGAKEWISKQLPSGRAYKETVHQAKITAHLDLAVLLQKSRDFAHLENAVMRLINHQLPN